MAIAPPRKFAGIESVYVPMVRLLVLRLLVRGGGQWRFLAESNFTDTSMARLVGFTDEEIENYDRPKSRQRLQLLLAGAEGAGRRVFPKRGTLAKNVQLVSDGLGLTEVEQKLLHFIALERSVDMVSDAADMIGPLSLDRLLRVLAAALQASVSEVRAALDPAATLSRAGLVWVDRTSAYPFRQKIEVDDTLADQLSVPHKDLRGLFARHVAPAPKPALSLQHFPHVAHDCRILATYLADVLQRRTRGVNVLIHGQPGTGKTEFVRALAQQLGAELFEVAVQEANGMAKEGMQRLGAYRLAQALLAKGAPKLLLFDEVEDVFPDRKRFPWDDANRSGIKGWVNKALEGNAVPTFWVTNRLDALDTAYRRRFDYVLRMESPPRSVRERVLQTHVDHLPLSRHWREEAANHPSLTPALVGRAARVVSRLHEREPGLCVEQAMTRVVNNTLEALGRSPIAFPAQGQAMEYRLDLLNADTDLATLEEGLRRTAEARLCLYGPPGTGKSEFARHLAQALDRPLLVRRASDILGPYVGQTERNLAEMFREAQGEGAVLLLDEAESFLQDRRKSRRQWEVTQVNEMLTQMETFRGIFIASTNLIDDLDPASLRRFDAKIKLDFLKPAQAWAMFEAFQRQRGVEAPLDLRREVERLAVLTPGDFAAVARRLRLGGEVDPRAVVRMLEAECAIKRGVQARAIGFS